MAVRVIGCIACGGEPLPQAMWCLPCMKASPFARARRPNPKKTCPRCLTAPSTKAYSRFCSTCDAERKDEWRKRHAGTVRQTEGKVERFIFTKAEREAWIAERDGRCDICGVQKRLDTDHDHATQKFRGMLCRRCNLTLGHWQDSVELLQSAITYLERSREGA